MIVIIVETEPYPTAIIGLTPQDIEESEGAPPCVDLKTACLVAGVMRPPAMVQVLIGRDDDDVTAFVREAFPEMDVLLVASNGDDVEEAVANSARIRAERMINRKPGALN